MNLSEHNSIKELLADPILCKEVEQLTGIKIGVYEPTKKTPHNLQIWRSNLDSVYEKILNNS